MFSLRLYWYRQKSAQLRARGPSGLAESGASGIRDLRLESPRNSNGRFFTNRYPSPTVWSDLPQVRPHKFRSYWRGFANVTTGYDFGSGSCVKSIVIFAHKDPIGGKRACGNHFRSSRSLQCWGLRPAAIPSLSAVSAARPSAQVRRPSRAAMPLPGLSSGALPASSATILHQSFATDPLTGRPSARTGRHQRQHAASRGRTPAALPCVWAQFEAREWRRGTCSRKS